MYYARRKAQELGITLEEYLQRKKNQSINTLTQPRSIDLTKVKKLENIHIDSDMLSQYKSGLVVDTLFSYEGGIPVGTNIMCTGDPGVGKTTVLLHTLSNLQKNNPDLKCLFVCAEMSKIQMFKYMQRFPVFGNVETIFASDYLDSSMKSVIEGLFSKGYDYILVDSIVEVLEAVKEDAGMSQGQAEKWLIDICVKHNEGYNELKKFTTFLLIQQVTKAGVFVGSNKLKHITDAHMEMKREKEVHGGGTYIVFSKNRNGQAGLKFGYQLTNNEIQYGTLVEEQEEEEVKAKVPEFELTTNS
jgi:DNA repair protein RadA/Sms